METGYLVVLVIMMLGLAFLLLRTKAVRESNSEGLTAEVSRLKIALAKAEERASNTLFEKTNLIQLFKEEKISLENELRREREKHTETSRSLESVRAYLKAQQEKITEQKAEIDTLREKFNKDFEIIASKILEEKTHKFTEANKLNLDILLNPLKENIKAFEEKVEKVYKAESNERHVLKGEISKLMELNRQISEEAHNLTKALKADTKKQGNWGEIVLDKILEASGLIPGENYIKQNSFTGPNGSRLQPDIVITLPENKHIVIDSKVSLTAYERLVNCDNDEERSVHLKSHLASLKNHITGLNSKNYQHLYGINSPDFVLLFVPIESSFAIAIQNDQDLFDFAWNKQVVLVTPSTLLATLKTVASIWKQEQQTQNAVDIAVKAGALYDKFVGFITDLKKIGDNLDKAREAYNDAFGKLSSGNGNLIGRVESLKKMGAKAGKQIDKHFLLED